MNILLIPNNDWLSHPVPAQRHYKIFEMLGQKHNVYVLHFELFADSKTQTHNPKFTKIIKLFTLHLHDAAQFYIMNFPFQITKVLAVIKELAIDVVFGSHLAVCTMGFAASKIHRVKRVFDLSDFFPGSVLAYYPRLNPIAASLMQSSAKYMMDLNIKMSNLCTTCSESLKTYAQKVSPLTRVEQIPNGVDTKIFSPAEPSQRLLNELNLQDNATLIYIGSIESWVNFTPVLKALSILKAAGTNVQLLIVGRRIYKTRGSDPLALKIKKHGLEDQVKFTGYQPYESLPDFVNLAVAGLIPFKANSLLTRMAFPNKLVEYLACGRPVICPPLKELVQVGGEYVRTYSDPKSLSEQIKQTLATDYDRKEIRAKALSYDWRVIVEKLDNLLHQITS